MLQTVEKTQLVEGSEAVSKIINQLEQIVVGKTEQLQLALCCILANGHLLIEDQPGTGKTVTANTFARVLGLDYQRVQFTNDLLPSDILGGSIFHRDKGEFEFKAGPIFNQLLLADEINRATPKTQSALLEAMEEQQVSLDGVTRPLPKPFFVIATQNPHDQYGTFPLPEAQLDRFLMRIEMGYLSQQAELDLYAGVDRRELLQQIKAVTSTNELLAYQQQCKTVHASEAIYQYIYALVNFTRHSDLFQNSLSPRAGLALLACAKTWAWMQGEEYVLPQHVQKVLTAVIGHRLRFKEGGTDPLRAGKIVKENVAVL
ncbi:MAG: AAA domain-containing protein [Alteromonadales bacterium]|nr:AAA domain-containing protein [Alteromonadales bacterium]